MAIDPAARAELDRRMEERRAELGLRWREVADAASITVGGLHNIRKGPSQVPPFTRRVLERVFKWPTGEIDRILEGIPRVEGDPPTDEEIAAMGYRGVARYSFMIEDRDGRVASLEWLAHAIEVLIEAAERNTPIGHPG